VVKLLIGISIDWCNHDDQFLHMIVLLDIRAHFFVPLDCTLPL